jgi:dihydrodiol dehydrogenase / D-xylose 1-dehydrogenase (NADP)
MILHLEASRIRSSFSGMMSDSLLSSTIPAPLDDLSSTDNTCDDDRLTTCPTLKWGILGCGRVSHDFCLALRNHVPTAILVACATANDTEPNRSQEFATKHGISTAYTNYQALVDNPDIDIVYVGNVHAFRRETGETCLNAGKHVLLEKPFTCTVEDAEYLISLARTKRLFLQEGMWTRFFPAVEQARQIVTQGIIGNVVNVNTDFHFNASDSEHYPSSFVYQRKLGGGASLLVAPYPIAHALLFLGGRMPDQIHVVGQVDTDRTGVDLQAAMSLRFDAITIADTNTVSETQINGNANSSHVYGTGVATISYGILGESEEVTTVVGTLGRLTIHSPCHCPTSLTVTVKAFGRGQATQTTHYNFPLPKPIQRSDGSTNESLEYFYPNSACFCYEAAAIARCIAKGESCCPQYTLDETIIVQTILAEARQQLKVQSVYE